MRPPLRALVTVLNYPYQYWASCLKAYEGMYSTFLVSMSFNRLPGQFKYPAVQRYLHDLSSELGEHIDSITSSLSVFIEIGLSSHETPDTGFAD